MPFDDFIPTFDLGDFRYAVARYVRLLIRARLTQQPPFFSPSEREVWDLKSCQGEPLSTDQLLDLAAGALAHLNTEFIPRCGSGGLQHASEETPLGRLMLASLCLVDCPAFGPEHNGSLNDAAQAVRLGRTLDWDRLVNWSSLPAIRADLNQLPHPSPLIPQRLEALEARVRELAQEHPSRQWYSVAEFAELVGKVEFTVREWCRQGRIRAKKQQGGRGRHQAWVISRDQLARYRQEGLIPVPGA